MIEILKNLSFEAMQKIKEPEKFKKGYFLEEKKIFGSLIEIQNIFGEISKNYNIKKDLLFYDYDSFYTLEQKTEKEIFAEKEKSFERKLWYLLYEKLIKEGYKRTGFDSGLLKDFKKSAYEMALAEDWEQMEKYYFLRFKK